MPTVTDLKKAKQYSDAKQYEQKHQLLYQLIKNSPEEFYVDSDSKGILGLTHELTGFKIHVPKQVVKGLDLRYASADKISAAAKSLTAGAGMPNITGGGQGSYMKMPSLFGNMKSQLTKATKQVGEQNKPNGQLPEQKPNSAAGNLFPETSKFLQQKFQNPMPFAHKTSALTTGNISRGLGYSPGVWYGDNTFSPAAQTRVGNVITGLGLSGLGLLSIPMLQYFFPERFKGKGGGLAALSILGGMTAPWIMNAPSTAADLAGLGLPSNKDYTDKTWRENQLAARVRSGIIPTGVNAAIAEGQDPRFVNTGLNALSGPPTFNEEVTDPRSQYNAGSDLVSKNPVSGVKQNAYIPMDLEIAKTHLANVTAEQMRSGYVDYGQAAGLMLRASQESNKPWVTVRDLANAAIGAGAGAIAGTVAAKGIGMFANLTPTERLAMQGTGAALGTLINLGKLGF